MASQNFWDMLKEKLSEAHLDSFNYLVFVIVMVIISINSITYLLQFIYFFYDSQKSFRNNKVLFRGTIFFTIILIASLAGLAYSVYGYVYYGPHQRV